MVPPSTIQVNANPTYAYWLWPASRCNLTSGSGEVSLQRKLMISIVDDDESAREGLIDLVKSMGFVAEAFQCAEDFLKSGHLDSTSCLIADVQMPEMTGLELHNR